MCVLMLSSCLTTQHYNNGKTLKSGKSVVVWGAGYHKYLKCTSRDYRVNETNQDRKPNTKKCLEAEGEEIDETYEPQVSRKFRLGVRDNWGPFPGLDIGYSFEALGGVEFDGRLALPYVIEELNHSISAGWVIGNWADNTLFMEYAFSKDFLATNLYINIRESYVATQTYDLDIDGGEDDVFIHNQKWVTQLGFGMRYEGTRRFLLPNIFYAHGTITAPAFSFVDRIEGDMKPVYQFSPSVGVGWTY